MPFSNLVNTGPTFDTTLLPAVIKRLVDIALAAIAALLLAPVILLLAIGVAVFLGGPVFFVQQRPGFKGKPFKLVKFRTMLDAQDARGRDLPDAERLTAFGRVLRKTSLDELPELWNVLRGDMSLVGPRPLLTEYLPRYSKEQMRRHDVLPGITGWAQINGRNRVAWEEKFELDIWYVDNHSLWLDLKIMAMTLAAVFRTRDIAQAGHVTAEKFKGSK